MCTTYEYYFEEIPENMSSVELLLGGNAGAYIFHMDVCRPEYQRSNMYLRFADKLNAKVSNDAETRFEIGFSLQDALVDVKMILSIFVFNLR